MSPPNIFHTCPCYGFCGRQPIEPVEYLLKNENDWHGSKDEEWGFLAPCFCISLCEREDRASRAARELCKAGMCRVVIFYRPQKDRTPNLSAPSIRGCWESHRTCLSQLFADPRPRPAIDIDGNPFVRGAELMHPADHWEPPLASLLTKRNAMAFNQKEKDHHVTVIEDDIKLVPTIRQRARKIKSHLESIKGSDPNWRLFCLGTFPFGMSPSFIGPGVWTSRHCLGMHFYCASLSACAWLRDRPYDSFDSKNLSSIAAWLDLPWPRWRHGTPGIDSYLSKGPGIYLEVPMVAFQAGATDPITAATSNPKPVGGVEKFINPTTARCLECMGILVWPILFILGLIVFSMVLNLLGSSFRFKNVGFSPSSNFFSDLVSNPSDHFSVPLPDPFSGSF